MKNNLFIRIASGIIAVVLLFSLPSYTGNQNSNEKISEPFRYSGHSTSTYSGYEKTSAYVKMVDGTKLAVDIYLPTNGPEQEVFPVIFQYTPYGRAFVARRRGSPAAGRVHPIRTGICHT